MRPTFTWGWVGIKTQILIFYGPKHTFFASSIFVNLFVHACRFVHKLSCEHVTDFVFVRTFRFTFSSSACLNYITQVQIKSSQGDRRTGHLPNRKEKLPQLRRIVTEKNKYKKKIYMSTLITIFSFFLLKKFSKEI